MWSKLWPCESSILDQTILPSLIAKILLIKSTRAAIGPHCIRLLKGINLWNILEVEFMLLRAIENKLMENY